MTNVVKLFSFTRRGKRRIHQKPAAPTRSPSASGPPRSCADDDATRHEEMRAFVRNLAMVAKQLA